jgi:predicted amidohydrolase YtcJ
MSISVKFASYSPEELERVVNYYNQIKPSHNNVIEELDRCEGGFKIAQENDTEIETADPNQGIKQLRWKNRKLDPMNYRGFTPEETLRLYQSLVHVFGQSLVSYDDPIHKK